MATSIQSHPDLKSPTIRARASMRRQKRRSFYQQYGMPCQIKHQYHHYRLATIAYYLPVAGITMAATEAFLVLIAFYAIYEAAATLGLVNLTSQPQWFWLSSLSIVVVNALMGHYPGYGLTGAERLAHRFKSWLYIAIPTCLYLPLLSPQSATWLAMVVVFTLFMNMSVLPVFAVMTRRLLILARCWGTPVALIHQGDYGRKAERYMDRSLYMGYYFAVALPLDQRPIPGIYSVDSWREMREHAKDLSTCIVAIHPRNARQTKVLSRRLARLSCPRMMFFSDRIGVGATNALTRWVGENLAIEVDRFLAFRSNWVLKRTFDYVAGIPMALLSLPILACAAIAIKWADPSGPVFYSQQREGLDGRKIHVLKLRTMYNNAEERLKTLLQENPEAKQQWEERCKLPNDPRILPGIGHFLRKTSLDELPQLFNVIRGEMSLVGPRPFPDYHLAMFTYEFRVLRRTVMPGITGLWQCKVRSDSNLKIQEQMDRDYISHWSLWLDLSLLSQRFAAIFL